jgi:hypothetical protein
MLTYLKGTEIRRDDLKKYLGKKVVYLRNMDIDKSGRGYFFPRYGTITGFYRSNVEFDNNGSYQSIRDIREIAIPEEIEGEK